MTTYNQSTHSAQVISGLLVVIHENKPVTLSRGGELLSNLSLLALASTIVLSVATNTGGTYATMAVLCFVAIRTCWLALIDFRHKLIPDIIVLPTLTAVLGAYLFLASLTGQWESLWRSLAGCAAAGGIYYFMAYFGSLGRGDIKLGLLLATVLGWYSWPAWTGGMLLPPFIAAAAALVFLARGASKHSHLAYGPAMILGAAGSLAITLTS